MVDFLEPGGGDDNDEARRLVHDLSNELSVLVHYTGFVADGLAVLEAGVPLAPGPVEQLRSQVDVLRSATQRSADLIHRLRAAVSGPDGRGVTGGAVPAGTSAPPPSAPASLPSPSDPLPGPDRPPHVLVVEDDDAVRALTVRILTRADYQVTSAASGREAIELIAGLDGQVDLVLSDLRMEDVSGIELDERIRSVWPTLRTLFMSGARDDAALGPDGAAAPPGRPLRVVDKPFTVEELLRRVEEALRGA